MYTDIGMVTMTNKRVPAHYRDLYDEMYFNRALFLDDGRLEEFMLTSFQCDFLILEYTQELMEEPWFGRFERLLHDYSISTSIPIIMFIYDEHTLNKN